MHTRRTFAGALLGASFYTRAEGEAWPALEDAAEMLQKGKMSPVDLTQECLRRIEKLNPRLNAFITVTAVTAMQEARACEAELRSGRRRGVLHGIPVALKDLIDTAGIRTTAGSAQFENRVPQRDAEVVRRLKAAGAVLVGKLNMDEFAYSFTSETSRFGPSRNPWDTRRSPGGSSGGAAVAVATGMCFAALGSDTGGSIRLPAALCGITGLKPSYGLVSTEGAAPLAWSLDHIGPMCRSARDAAHVLAAIAEEPVDTRAVLEPAVKKLRIGVPRAMYFDQLDAEVAKAVAAALDEAGRLTAGARDVNIPPLPRAERWPDLPLAYSRLISAEAYAWHEEMLKQHPERYNPATRAIIEGGAAVSAAFYIRARREMERLRAEARRLFEHADVLVTPTAPAPAFELGKPASLVYLRNCAPWNLYGLPAISIPCGFTAAGLPVGLQITGPPGGDATVLALAAAYQQATNWHRKRPPVAG